MVALPPAPPPSFYYTPADTSSSTNGPIAYDTTSDSTGQYIQVVDEDLQHGSSITYVPRPAVIWIPVDWFHCGWLPEEVCWWPDGKSPSDRDLLHRKARMRYPVGEP